MGRAHLEVQAVARVGRVSVSEGAEDVAEPVRGEGVAAGREVEEANGAVPVTAQNAPTARRHLF